MENHHRQSSNISITRFQWCFVNAKSTAPHRMKLIRLHRYVLGLLCILKLNLKSAKFQWVWNECAPMYAISMRLHISSYSYHFISGDRVGLFNARFSFQLSNKFMWYLQWNVYDTKMYWIILLIFSLSIIYHTRVIRYLFVFVRRPIIISLIATYCTFRHIFVYERAASCAHFRLALIYIPHHIECVVCALLRFRRLLRDEMLETYMK